MASRYFGALHANKRQKVTHDDMQQLPAAIVKELRDKYVPSEIDNLVERVMTRMTDERYVIHYEGLRGVGEYDCLLYTSPSPRDRTRSRMPSSA